MQRTANVYVTYSAFAWRIKNLLSVFKTYAERTERVHNLWLAYLPVFLVSVIYIRVMIECNAVVCILCFNPITGNSYASHLHASEPSLRLYMYDGPYLNLYI